MGFIDIFFDPPTAAARVARSVCMATAAAFLVAGCATTKFDEEQAQARLEAAMVEADKDLAHGDRDKAVHELQDAAKDNPTSVEPWLKIANIWFDSGNYPSSIVAANEALQRDAGNQEAKSVLVVAGLRVAAGAVTGLRVNDKLGVGSRVEAEELTKALRQILGEEVLVPAPVEASKKTAPAVVRARPRVRHAVHPKSKPALRTPDPFAALK